MFSAEKIHLILPSSGSLPCPACPIPGSLLSSRDRAEVAIERVPIPAPGRGDLCLAQLPSSWAFLGSGQGC